MIRKLLLAVLLSLQPSTAALFAQPRIIPGPTHRLGEEFTLCCSRVVPAVWDGSSFTVFWNEDGEVMARRVNRFGEPLGGAVLIAKPWSMVVPAFDGIDFLVFLSNGIDGRDSSTRAQRLRANLDSLGEPVNIGSVVTYDAVFDGQNYVVVSGRPDPALRVTELWLSRISRDGQVIESERVEVNPPVNVASGATIATNGTEFVVAWVDFVPTDCVGPCGVPTNLRIISFDARLELTGWRGEAVARNAYHPSLIWSDTHFTLVWNEISRVSSQRLYSGPWVPAQHEVVLDVDKLFLTASAAWDGRYITVAAETGFGDNSVYIARLTRKGERVDSITGTPVLRSLNYLTATTLTGGTEGSSLVTYISGKFPTYAVHGTPVQTHGTTSKPRRAVRQ